MEMRDRVVGGKEHGNLCLVAIYAIHVVLLHVFLSPKVATRATLAPGSDRIAPERRTRTTKDKVQSASLFVGNAIDVGGRGCTLRKTSDGAVREERNILPVFPDREPVPRWSKSHSCTYKNVSGQWTLTTSFCMHSLENSVSVEMMTHVGPSRLNKVYDDSQCDKNIRILIRTNENETASSVVLLPTNSLKLTIKGLSPAAWGVLLGCLVFLLTYRNEKELNFKDKQYYIKP